MLAKVRIEKIDQELSEPMLPSNSLNAFCNDILVMKRTMLVIRSGHSKKNAAGLAELKFAHLEAVPS